ncbi:response regulator [Heliorestis convoluta]|uniref:Stage 0 sporulation protein A homolog n=1 Tax=Heliorestis convoluta TaxID=356322 RepID=A0A5Q2MYJ7_9FIRM|nr:response regulator [Heliorestis convoluta]QGG46449.1 response regulator [Heliorestis convoluta]
MGKTIFIVDDSVTMLLNIKMILEQAGYTVYQARDGLEALESLKKIGKVDGIISDVNMPTMDGYTFILELRAQRQYRFTPIIMLTTESQAAKKEKGRQAGATGWITKPFQPEQLLQVLQRVIK